MKKGRKHTKSEVDRILKDIRSMQQNNKSSEEIRALLHLELRQYQIFCSRIYKQDQDLWRSITSEQLEYYLVKLKDSLEHLYQVVIQLSKQEDYKDKIGAAQAAAEARLSVVQILLNSPTEDMLTNNNVQQEDHKKRPDYAAIAARAYKHHNEQSQKHP